MQAPAHLNVLRAFEASWLRLPAERALRAHVGGEGARVWDKAAPPLHDDACRFDA